MRRGVALLLLAVALAGGAAVLLVGGSKSRPDVLVLADDPVIPLAGMKQGDRFCQDPVRLPGRVSSIFLVVAPGTGRRGPVEVTLRTPGIRGGDVLATADLSRRQLEGPTTLDFDHAVSGPRTVAICVENQGREVVQVFGDSISQGRPTLRTSEGYLNGVDTGGDMTARFPATKPRTVLDRVPAAVRAMAAYKLGGIGPWLPWTLLVLVAVGVPLMLARALVRAGEAEDARPAPAPPRELG